MIFTARVLLASAAAIGITWTAAAGALAALELPRRTAVFATEPQSVHLARRVQLREALYPDWRTFPYVANVFTPGYFWVVGLLGRSVGADLEGLERIARGVTVACSLAAAGLAFCALRSRGRAASIAATGVVYGAGVTHAIGWMARPDMAADALGFAGFLAATGAFPAALAAILLTAAALCKQTALVYAAAAAAALVWQGKTRRALAVFLGALALGGAVLGLVFAAGERRVFTDILLEGSSPWRWAQWSETAGKLFGRSAEVAVLAGFGAAVWGRAIKTAGPSADEAKRWLALLAVAGGAATLAAAKQGSDLYYFLPLRFVAAAALCELFRILAASADPAKAAGVALASLALLWGWSPMVWNLLRMHEALNPARRRATDAYEAEIDALALRARTERIFTDNDDLALRIDNPLNDAFLFKLLVDTGRLKPDVLIERLRRGEYDLVVTTEPLGDRRALVSSFALPKPVADAVASRYDLVSRSALCYYRPKPTIPRAAP